jgi:hypothetical protein
MNSPEANDAGLGAWLRKYVEDRRVRQVLTVVVALVLIGTFSFKAFSGVPAALEILAIEVCFIYASLLIITTSVAVWPLDQNSKNSTSTLNAQRNARGSLVFLIVLGAALAFISVNVVSPIWPAILSEAAYQELRWGLISLPEYFSRVSSPDRTNDDIVSDVGDPGSLFENGRIQNLRKLLQILSQHPEAQIDQLDLRGIRHTAVIVAKKVIFDQLSAVELGRTNLLVLTVDIQVTASPTHGAAIFAYRPGEAPARRTGTATAADGLSAGKMTLVVLGKFVDGPPLILDLRGQRGGEGAKGVQPNPRDPRPNLERLNGSPSWTFGERSPAQIDKRIASIEKILECQKIANEQCKKEKLDDKLPPNSVSQLEQLKNSLQQCKDQKGHCSLEYCLQTTWNSDGKGFDGLPGLSGEPGAKGGSPGDAGRLAVYRLASNAETNVQFASHLRWLDSASVDHPPPAAAPGNGGQGGDGGQGGPGGLGYRADPLGLCPTGDAGSPGALGLPGPPGADGDGKDPGPAATIGVLADLSSF